MCATFLLSSEDSTEIRNICEELTKKYGKEATDKALNTDLYPKSTAAVIGAGGRPALLKWGFPFQGRSDTLFNARAESLETKGVYRSILNNRCLIPATRFYEWDKAKKKYVFTVDSGLFFMAGLWKTEMLPDGTGAYYFTIITTEPNTIVGGVHNRMPAIIPKSYLNDWLKGANALSLLHPYVGGMMLKAV